MPVNSQYIMGSRLAFISTDHENSNSVWLRIKLADSFII